MTNKKKQISNLVRNLFAINNFGKPYLEMDHHLVVLSEKEGLSNDGYIINDFDHLVSPDIDWKVYQVLGPILNPWSRQFDISLSRGWPHRWESS